MASKRPYNLSLELNENALMFFPDAVGKDQVAFRESVTKRVRGAFDHLDGVLQSITVSDTLLRIVWLNDQNKSSDLNKIAKILSKGNYPDGILLLELFLSNEPEDPDLLYNLGMAYSDQNNLDRSIALLTKLVEKEPEHINGRVALGVALLRKGRNNEGIQALETAVKKDPQNLWAHRNLSAGLMRLERYSEAEGHLRLATEIDPDDQASWYGYGQALEYLEKHADADDAYLKAIDIDEHSNIAELARQARSTLAQKSFRAVTPGVERMDAVMYCLGALERFAAMSPDEVQKIGIEIALLGTKGIDVNSSAKQYTLRSLPGNYSGLHLLSLEYVAFKQFAPDQSIGFDLAAEYHMALTLLEKKGRKEK